MNRILVVGGSGTVGSAIVDRLGAAGAAVRAATRRPKAASATPGIEHVAIDLAAGSGVREAFEGVARAFLLAPPGFADQHRLLAPAIAEARRRGLERVVLMSAMGANAADTPFRRAELELESSGVPFNIIRPNWFMQNFNTFWVGPINEQGKILLPAGKAKVSFIDARDIAAVAVRLLTTDDQVGGDFDLTGPEALDHDEVARILAEASGREIVYENIEPGMLRDALLAAGLPREYVEFLLVILGFLAQGYNARVTDDVARLLGRAPTAFRTYAQDYRAAWAKRP